MLRLGQGSSFHDNKPITKPIPSGFFTLGCHLVVVVRLGCLNDPKSCACWDSSPWQVEPCRIGRGVEARQSTAPGPPGWGLGGGPITHLLKTKQITETLNTRRQSFLGANVVPCLSKQSMTPSSQGLGGSSGAEQTTNDTKGSDKNRELECENDVYYRKIRTSCESDESDEDPNYENGVDQGQHGGGRRRGKGKRLNGRIGVRYKSQRLAELVGGVVLRPYMPHGTKWIGKVRYYLVCC